MRRVIGIVLIVVLTVLASVAEQTRAQLWQSYAGYTSPYLGLLPSGALRPSLSPRIILVLIHSLRLAESRQMPTLNALRENGADVTIELRPPTYRLPATFGWLSGAQPETHGVTTNEAIGSTAPDTIFRTVQTSGRLIAVAGSDQLIELLGDAVQRREIVDDVAPAQRDQQALNRALDVLSGRDDAEPARFVVVEFGVLENVARNDPGSYNAAVAATDFRLKSLVDALNFNADTLVVMSDRGWTRQGNDGGDEAEVARVPLVLAGAGVVARAQAISSAVSVAPTLAALTGAPIPTHAQGGPIFAALVPQSNLPLASAQQLTAFYEQWSEVIGEPRFASALLRKYEMQLAGGDVTNYAVWLTELNNAISTAITARLSGERAARLPFVIGVGLLLLTLTGLLLNERIAPPLIGAGVYLVGWLALFFLLREGGVSLSLFRDGDPAPLLRTLERESAALMGIVCIFVALSTGGHEDAFEAITTVLNTLGLVTIFHILLFMGFYWQWGDVWTWTLPESSALVAALLALTQVAGLTVEVTPPFPEVPLALLVAVVTALIYAVVRRR